jgi:MSHA biogenesis protein MshJ
MNNSLIKLDRWYRLRNTRERIFIMLLGCAFIYAIFYFILFRTVEYKRELLRAEIHIKENQISSWSLQINAVKKIASSPLYQKWKTHEEKLKALHKKYENFILPPTSTYWQNAIKTVLSNQKTITTDEIKYFPATLFSNLSLTKTKTQVFEQKVHVTVYGNYFDTIDYLKNLEKALPIAQWESLNYQVAQYPTAKVEVEFSILYEQTS